ncbi:hypothetical protein [Mycolicibacterium doricum]|uniref:hypothetical protein n=1 Tax=Mycolicibacterium doricum TaxID=126673 RepID=UPI0013D15B43|nr:hypothetical protein [Mycolicibacterium doricum]
MDTVAATAPSTPSRPRPNQHLDAGADQVPVQVLTGPDKLVAGLAGPLAHR